MSKLPIHTLLLASLFLVACASDTDPMDIVSEHCAEGDFDCLSGLITSPDLYCDGDNAQCGKELGELKIAFLEDPNSVCPTEPRCQPLADGLIRSANEQTEQVFLDSRAISSLIANGTRDVDYWYSIDWFSHPAHGDAPGEVAGYTLLLDKPASWRGVVDTATNPCGGHGDEGYYDPGDPCLDEPREFGTKFSFVRERCGDKRDHLPAV